MTFSNTTIQYHVTLNTKTQVFMVYDAQNHEKVAYGVTIEKAVKELQKSI